MAGLPESSLTPRRRAEGTETLDVGSRTRHVGECGDWRLVQKPTKYPIESYHDSDTDFYFYSYCARCQCFTVNGTQNTVMPVNAVAENVFGTMGQSASWSSTSSFQFPRRFYPPLSRCDLLDRTAHPTAIQNLANKVHQRALTLARVSRTSASIHPSPAPSFLSPSHWHPAPSLQKHC